MISSAVTIYDRVLYSLLVNNVAEASSLFIIAKNKQSIYRAIQKALENKHVKRYKLRLHTSKGVRMVTYYGLTKCGVKYLRGRSKVFPDEQKWMAYLPYKIDSLDIFDARSWDQIYRNLLLSSVNIAMAQFGFKCYPIFTIPGLSAHDQDSQSSNSSSNESLDYNYETFEGDGSDEVEKNKQKKPPLKLSEVVKECLQMSNEIEMNIGGAVINTDAKIEFYNAKEILKREFSKRKSTNPYNSDKLRFGTQAGIAESPVKTVLVYAGSRLGMSWEPWDMRNDEKAFHAFKTTSRYRNINFEKTEAILLVEDAKAFKELFFDEENKRKPHCKFGGEMDSLLIIPNTRSGMQNFKEFLLSDREEVKNKLKEAAIESGQFKERIGQFDKIFCLKSRDGVLTYLGTFIDGVEIRELLTAIQVLQEPYQIICYDWQEEFYKNVIPKVSFVNVHERVEP